MLKEALETKIAICARFLARGGLRLFTFSVQKGYILNQSEHELGIANAKEIAVNNIHQLLTRTTAKAALGATTLLWYYPHQNRPHSVHVMHNIVQQLIKPI